MNNASSSASQPQRHNHTHQQQQQQQQQQEEATPIDTIPVLTTTTANNEEEDDEDDVPPPPPTTNEDDDDDDDNGELASPPLLLLRRKKRRNIQRDQKIQFFDHLIRNLDMVIYCQLSTLYYMDISFLSLLIRAIFHYILLTPKPSLPPPFQPFPPSPSPFFSLISLTNLIPTLMHVFTRPPRASEAARGYLHGGILIDFVGQAPVSKLRLVVLDCLVLGLQLVMMTLVLKRRELGPPPAGGRTHTTTTAGDGYALPTTPPRRRRRRRGMPNQDYDAEERGVLLPSSYSSPTAAELGERQHPSLPGDHTEGAPAHEDGGSPDNGDDDDDNSSSDSSATANEQHALDGFRSGQYVIANLHLLSTIRNEWMRHTRDAASLGSVASVTETRTGTGRPGTGTTTRRRMPMQRGVRRMGRTGRRRRGGGEWSARLRIAVGAGLAGWR